MADRDCPLVALEGGARKRGEIHGEHLRARIAAGIERWHQSLATETGEDPATYLADFVATTDFEPAIERWTPELLEEVRGIADGAGQPYETMLAYNLMDEEWLHQRRRSDGEEPHHCSAAARRPADGQPTLVAQNMDLPQHFDGSQVILRIVPDGGAPEVLVLSAAGLIATTGLNRAGVGVCVNALTQLDNEPYGLPIAFGIRGVLARRTRDEAAAFLRSVQHASGQNWMIGDPTGVTDLECSARGAVEYAPDGPVITHTNHPLASDSQHTRRTSRGSESAVLNSKQRLALLDRELAAGVSDEAILNTLRDRTVPVCRVADDSGALTFGTVLHELGDQPVLHVTPGPPNEEPIRQMRFDT